MKQLLTKYQIFTKLYQIPRIRINRTFSSIIASFLDQLLHLYKSYGRDMAGILFFIFARCEPLTSIAAITTPPIIMCFSYYNLVTVWNVSRMTCSDAFRCRYTHNRERLVKHKNFFVSILPLFFSIHSCPTFTQLSKLENLQTCPDLLLKANLVS